MAAAATLGPAALGDALAEAAKKGRPRFPHPKNPAEALAILKKGNKRYRKGKLEFRDYSPVGEDIANNQKPFAAIITCADSRLSPPLVFDVERGNVFVSRIAGNSVDTGTLGSTEYGIKVLGVKLVMVLGHSDCGAVKSAISVANGGSYPPDQYGAIGDVVGTIVPPIKALPPSGRTLPKCIPLTARTQAADLASRGPIVKQAIAAQKIRVVAAVYDINTGAVSIL
ncbi:MAG: carbonic anhydrase [Solirubrobacterales bacterium]|nr:carbonic anhydrase [Solirubrobacterales bacterium]